MAWLVAAFFFLAAVTVYAAQVRAILRDGCKVVKDELGFPELLMSFVFAGFFTMLSVSAVQKHGGHEPPASIDSVLPNSLIFIIFVIGIAGFMRYRGLSLVRAFGLRRVGAGALVCWAVGLIVATFPLAFAASLLTSSVIHDHLDPQPLVDLFNKVARQHDYGAMGKILVSAAFIQPFCEEFIFRGFFYGTWKRYLGPMGAGFLSCFFFAAFHTSLSAFLGLFVLAVCLNIAYERTGSLLVPIYMHALFNLTSLLVMFAQAQTSAAQ